MEEDYDSSDLEFDTPPNPFFAAGLQSIEAIIEHAAEDRITSKKLTKQLTFVEASKKTQYLSQLWYNRFITFRANVLKKSLDITPEADELERFLSSIVSRVIPRSKEIPSFTWLMGGLRRLLVTLTFHYRTFSLSKHESLRLKVVFQQLLNEGRITKEPSRVVQWVGSSLVRRLITAILREALHEGTPTWDKTIQKVLSLLLISALSCRSGDIMVAALDDQPLPFLCHDDITMKLVGGTELRNIEALIVIRNEKSKKHDPTKNRKVLLRCLAGDRDHILCLVKMIIISAMRLGAVSERSIQDILGSMASRKDKTLQWAYGRRHSPVLCAFEQGGSDFVYADRAASVRQPCLIIRDASLKAGVLARVIPHDLRRGAAKDSAHLRHIPIGLATSAVAADLGHSTHSLHAGITAAYVGNRNDDTWTRRVHAEFRDPFGPEVVEQGYKRQKLNAVEWACLYQDVGVDPSDHNAVRAVRDNYYATQEQVWRASQKDLVEPDLLEGNVGRPALEPLTSSQINQGVIRRRKTEAAAQLVDVVAIDDAELDTIVALDTLEGEALSPAGTGSATRGTDVRKSYMDDPQLWADVENMSCVIANMDDVEPDEGTMEAVFDQMEAPLELPPEFIVPGIEFITYLSQINVVRNTKVGHRKDKTLPDQYRGNSRAEPTLFRIYCRKTAGCLYFAYVSYSVSVHEASCSAKMVEAYAANDKSYECSVKNCCARFASVRGLEEHVRRQHDWQPRVCKVEGCDTLLLYQSAAELRKHQVAVHPSWIARTCPIGGCPSTTSYATALGLKRHLQIGHKIEDNDTLKQYTRVRASGFLHQPCAFLGCTNAKLYVERKWLIKHLEKQHGLTKEDAMEFIAKR